MGERCVIWKLHREGEYNLFSFYGYYVAVRQIVVVTWWGGYITCENEKATLK